MPVTAAAEVASNPRKGLHIALWIVQVLVGVAFVFAGAMKSLSPIDELAKQMIWPGQVPAALVRFVGISELAGGLGLLLPSLTRIKPILTPLAGAGLVVVMTLAAGYHVMAGALSTIAPSIVLGSLSAFVAWGRFRAAPIAPRG